MRKLLVLAGLAGGAAVVMKKFKAQQAPVWHTPDTDPEPTRYTDDPAGAGPDEALADAVEEPHRATTPDNPLEEVIIENPPADA